MTLNYPYRRPCTRGELQRPGLLFDAVVQETDNLLSVRRKTEVRLIGCLLAFELGASRGMCNSGSPPAMESEDRACASLERLGSRVESEKFR